MSNTIKTKVGIVIVSYNASLAVRVTLASLRQAKNDVAYELLLIDNASEPKEYKEILAAFNKHTANAKLPWEVVRLEKNKGFSGGNNVGIEKFLKDPTITHICLLNSDVIVSDCWLDNLVAKNKHIISAVTNKADSEQCVPTDYSFQLDHNCFNLSSEEITATCFNTINSFSQDWHNAWKGNLVKAEATFFCVLLSKELVEKVGLLDETFFPGGYEDDDYCLRVLNEGYDIFLARDVFIHHFGSASFGQLQSSYFSEKASKNKLYLERKHNIKCKRRPEKPVVSFELDVLFALEKKENHHLQAKYLTLYNENISALVNHLESEFSAIHPHLLACGQDVPDDLHDKTSKAKAWGSLKELWEEVCYDISKGFDNAEVSDAQIGIIREKLDELCSAVYLKAEANIETVVFLQAAGVFGGGISAKQKTSFQKLKWIASKGIPFLYNLRGIVFLGGYPYTEREKDGYFQRIKVIDQLFEDKWRIYVDHMNLASQPNWYDRPAPKTIVFHMNNHKHKWFMKLIVYMCVLKCRRVYSHSVLRMNDSNFGRIFNWPGITKVIDIHGVVPEEFRMHNDFFSAGIYDGHEKRAIEKADKVIVVTRAMQRYFEQKYQLTFDSAKTIVLPIFPNIDALAQNKIYPDGKPIVVYAGGTHKWQQVPKMLDAMNATKEKCVHKFFCPNPAEVLAMMDDELKSHPNVEIDTKPFVELLSVYEECHYGFILREDHIVNRAACPTKLVEYVAKGIVPIVDSVELGDFKEMGMRAITLQDFISGKIPTEEQRNEMAKANYMLYIRLHEINNEGKNTLQQTLNGNKSPKSLSTSARQIAKKMFPKNTFRGKALRKIFLKGNNENASSNEIAGAQQVVNQIKTVNTSQHISVSKEPVNKCDVVVQVNSFLVGGLENVVLAQIETFIEAGYTVNLLILGEAGAAAELAKEKGIALYVRTYSEEDYKYFLEQSSAKIVISHYSIYGTEICKQLGIFLLQVIHNTYMWFNNEELIEFNNAAKNTTAFVAVSDYVKEYSLRRLGINGDKCMIIPNGIDLSPFRDVKANTARKSLREKHGLSDDEFVFLSVGSITHQKNHLSTIKAFNMVLKYCKDVKLVILGKLYERQLWDEITDYISSNELEDYIIYAGESKNPAAYYAMADAFVHSAFFEGGQLSLLEAIAANLPVVTTDIGFAKHYKGKQGVSVVPAPVDIFDYRGFIWELTSTISCERYLAIEMMNTYNERVRPDFPMDFIDLFDKNHSFNNYVRLIEYIIENDKIEGYQLSNSWTEEVGSFVEESKPLIYN
ncbi:glycosyltransferase [Chitinophagaceae bacterium 26-R-25]|nr:glycosyltransferase [Chitinophagaceae bacterium 26-R-25]